MQKMLIDKNNLPETFDIKSTTEIKVGMKFLYTGNPRGTGMFVPDIGSVFEVTSPSDASYLSIQIIERGRGWKPLMKPEEHEEAVFEGGKFWPRSN